MHPSPPPSYMLKFDLFSSFVAMKIRARSPKPYQVLIMPECYIHANLVPILACADSVGGGEGGEGVWEGGEGVWGGGGRGRSVRGSRPPPSLKNRKNIGFLSNTGPDPLKITKLPSQHSMLGHNQPASETPLWPVFSGI